MKNNISLIELLAKRRKVCRLSIDTTSESSSIIRMLELFDDNLLFQLIPTFPTSDDNLYMYVGYDMDDITDTISYDNQNDHENLGRMFGYPPCCIKSFCDHIDDTPNDEDYKYWTPAFELGKDQIDLYNDLAAGHIESQSGNNYHVENTFNMIMNPKLQLLEHAPCSLSCQPSIDIARFRDQFIYRLETPAAIDFNGTIFEFDL